MGGFDRDSSPPRLSGGGGPNHEQRQDDIRAAHGFSAMDTFDRFVARYNGNRAVKTLTCATQFQVMAFAQLTYRESLRDIEALRHVFRLNQQSSTIWVFADQFAAPHWLTPTKLATGGFTRSLPNG